MNAPRCRVDLTAVNRHAPQHTCPQGVRVAFVGGEKQIGHVYKESGVEPEVTEVDEDSDGLEFESSCGEDVDDTGKAVDGEDPGSVSCVRSMGVCDRLWVWVWGGVDALESLVASSSSMVLSICTASRGRSGRDSMGGYEGSLSCAGPTICSVPSCDDVKGTSTVSRSRVISGLRAWSDEEGPCPSSCLSAKCMP